jgi:hypothetical protein
MITTMQMYWLVTLDSIVRTSTAFSFVSALATIAAAGFAVDVRRFFWLPLVTMGMFFLSVAAATFIPTTKQAAAIIIVPKIVNNEKVQMVGNQLYDLAVDWMEELRPKKEKK